MLNVQQADVYTDFSGLAKLKNEARKESPEALKQVAKQFESIFLKMMLKNMRDAKLSDGIFDSDQSEFYQEMYDQQLAIHLSAESGIGLADMIVKQLSPEQSVTDKLALKDYFNKPVNIRKSKKVEELNQDAKPVETKKANKKIKSGKNLPIKTIDQFINQLKPYADKAAEELGVDSRMLMAQAALETGWGKSVIKTKEGSSSHNLFNIKADKSWHGNKAVVPTLEFESGIAKKTISGFRSYESYQDSFSDYVSFIKQNPRYSDAIKQVGSPDKYIQELQKAGYATDPRYAEKVMAIYNSNKMIAAESVVAMK